MTFFENALWTKETVPLGLIQPLGHRRVIIFSVSFMSLSIWNLFWNILLFPQITVDQRFSPFNQHWVFAIC